MNKHFKTGWRNKVEIADMGVCYDGTRLGWMVFTTYKGVQYVLQRDWTWSSCPLGISFKTERDAVTALVNVDSPEVQVAKQDLTDHASSILLPF